MAGMTTLAAATRIDPVAAQQRYDVLFEEVFALYTQGRYADALTVLDRRPAALAGVSP